MNLITPYERRKEIVPNRIYWQQCANSKTRGHNPPAYNKQELYEWITAQPEYDELFSTWEDSGYLSDLRPSCDRLDNSKGYTFDNIELVTWAENKKRANIDTKQGSLGSTQTPVYQYSPDGNFIAYHISQSEAERTTGINQQNISAVCRHLLQHTGGYRWFYEEQLSLKPITINNDYSCDIFCYNHKKELVEIYPELTYVVEDNFDIAKVRSVIRGEYATHKEHFFSFTEMKEFPTTTYVSKTVQQIDKEDNVVNTFESMSQASKHTGIGSGNISKCCNGKTNTAGGYRWKMK